MIRRVLVPSLALAASLAAAPAPGWVVVGEETCAPGFDVEQPTSADWEDLCSVAWRTVEAGEDVPTTLEVQLRLVGAVDERVGAAHYSSRWTAGGCVFTLTHRDATSVGSGEDVLRVRCGEVGRECETDAWLVGVDCRETADVLLDLETAPPVFGSDTVTWRVTFDEDLAPFAALHATDAVITPTRSIAGDEVRVDGVAGTSVYGGPSDLGVCVFVTCVPVDDWLDADRTFTIG